MANRTINGVFQLRGDTLANWKAKNPVLKDREVGIVVIPAGSESGLNEPAVLLKVGDGTTAFNSLGYVSAIAGDVSAWAKAATKPTYSAAEITGFNEAVLAAETDTQYKIEQDATNGHILKFYSKAKDAADYTLQATITTVDTVYDDSALAGRVTTAENDIDALELLVGNTSVQAQISAAIAALDLANTYEAKGAAAAVKNEVIGASTDTASDDTIYGAKKYAKEQADGKDAAIAAAKKAGDDAQADATAALAEAQAKVASVTAGDNTVTVGGTATAPTIAVKVDPAQNNAIQVGENGIKVVIPDAAVINVVKKATANTGYIASYQVTVDGTPVGVDIDIPKDYLVKDADIKVVETADDPYEGAVVGDKYIDFTVNTVEGTGNESHIYLPVNDLAHVYTAGNGIEISAADVISVKIDVTNANGLSVDANGLKLALVTQSTAGAMSAADKTKLDGVSTGANKTEASNTNGNIKIDGAETTVYTLPATVLDAGDTFTFDGGNA